MAQVGFVARARARPLTSTALGCGSARRSTAGRPPRSRALFDTVYVSFYKGLGGLAGPCLAGEEEVDRRGARVAQAARRHAVRALAERGVGARGAAAAASAACRGTASTRARSPRLLRGVPNVEVVPDPPQTPMMHLHLRVEEEAFLAAACRIAEEPSVFTWPSTSPGRRSAFRVVELTVGDATLGFEPERWPRNPPAAGVLIHPAATSGATTCSAANSTTRAAILKTKAELAGAARRRRAVTVRAGGEVSCGPRTGRRPDEVVVEPARARHAGVVLGGGSSRIDSPELVWRRGLHGAVSDAAAPVRLPQSLP